MAKTKNGAEETPEEVAGNESSNTAEVSDTVEAVVVEEKTVKFRALKNHECTIGGVKYILEKGKETRIPENIAVIFGHAEKGFRL